MKTQRLYELVFWTVTFVSITDVQAVPIETHTSSFDGNELALHLNPAGFELELPGLH